MQTGYWLSRVLSEPKTYRLAGRTTRQCRFRMGFTLMELVVSLSISSMLLVAIGGTITIAVQALPSKSDSSMVYLDRAANMNALGTELRYAISVTESSATMIEFTVADRDGDAVEETIRYEWSGTTGDPLTRQYNGGTVSNFIDSVQDLNLEYVLQTSASESPEQLLINQDHTTLSGNIFYYLLQPGQQIAETFIPNLPDDTTSWKVNRIQLYLGGQGNSNGVNAVDLTHVDADGEPDQVIDSVQVLESSLSTNFFDIAFSNGGDLDPTKRVAVMLRSISPSSWTIRGLGTFGGAADPTTSVYSNTGNGTWTHFPTQALYLRVYGTVTTQANLLSYTNIQIQYGDDPTDSIGISVPTLNKPAM